MLQHAQTIDVRTEVKLTVVERYSEIMTSAATVAVDGLDEETKTLISGEENVQQQLDGAVAKKMNNYGATMQK